MAEQATAAVENAMPKHGTFCWQELHSRNLESCKTFYRELFGWNMERSKAVGDEMEYVEFGAPGECTAGGMFQMGAEFGDALSHWMSYIAVDDVDESAKKVAELGGSVCVPPTDIPNVGRFSVINDPSGAIVSLITLKPFGGK